MSEVKIQAEPRTEFGKGAARRIRRNDKVPAVLYGHGTDPIHIALPGHDTMLALKNANALLSIDVQGENRLCIPKQVQRDPIKGFIEHVDLLIVRRGEKVVVDIPLVIEGDVVSEGLLVTENATLSVEAEATHIPEAIELNVEGLEVGDQILARDLKLPAGSTLQADDDTLIVHVTAAPTAEQLEEELAEAEADVGIEREESDAEAEAEAAAPAEGAEGETPEGGQAGEGEGSPQE
ncbi:MAG TPA: 50S ribosomal protein L25/general stress protein Ctc [Nocardioidaceae bacterium]|nr:50S ribosomal protein L25/general stress protein Ctc [Nocardioidaceae bacterium]